ncbi:MAG TPA: hypothetical protein VG935_03015 [Patescibacteria group bacterium]|nr:hypothetical protein [Patescibacteria group bacterium]
MKEHEIEPIQVIYGSHSEPDTHLIATYENAIDRLLTTFPQGQIGVFLEDASCTPFEAKLLAILSSQGMSSSNAYATMLYLMDKEEFPSDEQLIEAKEGILEELDPFLREQLNVLDNIHDRSPNRLVILSESIPADEAQEALIDGVPRNLILKRQALESAYAGNFNEALQVYQNCVNFSAEWFRAREQRIHDLIAHEIDTGKIIGFVGYIGAIHTPVSHKLQESGHRVQSSFAGSENGHNLMDPFSVAVRQRMFFPEEEISDEEWMVNLAEMVAYEIVAALMKDEDRSIWSDQRIINMAREATEAFTIQNVLELEAALKEDGINGAIDYFAVHSEKHTSA